MCHGRRSFCRTVQLGHLTSGYRKSPRVLLQQTRLDAHLLLILAQRGPLKPRP